MIDREVAQNFAQEWIESWNSHDLDRIVYHYSDSFEMTSPFIALMTGEPSASLQGKEKVAEYWKVALEKIPDLKFELIDVLFSVNSIIIYYMKIRLLARLIAVWLLSGAIALAKMNS
jgi:ketosteroid isomerase-like protein